MADVTQFFVTSPSKLLLVGALLLYVASRATVDTLDRATQFSGWRAFGHWIPIAATALVATLIHRADLAISIIFSTSVAILSLVLGSNVLVSPHADAPVSLRRIWPFVLPAALLPLMIGFAGRFTWVHALMLLGQGLMLWMAWGELSGADCAAAADQPITVHPFMRINFILCVALAVIGAVAGVIGSIGALGSASMAPGMSNLAQLPPATTIVVILAPLLVLPMLIAGNTVVRKNLSGVATTAGVGVVLLNLCLLLPAVVLLWYPVNAIHRGDARWHLKFTPLRQTPPLPFSWVTWRVDNVVLLLLAFILVPSALGRWRLGRAEGVTLIGLYVVYILMATAAGMRS